MDANGTASAGTRVAGSVRIVSEIAEFSGLFEDSVNVVVLERPRAQCLVHDAERAVRDPGARFAIAMAPLAADFSALPAALDGYAHLAADLLRWMEVLRDLTGCKLVGVRLARLDAAMCPRFHVDRVAVRAVITFVGSGTEYLASEDVDRSWLGHAATHLRDETSGLLRQGAVLRKAAAGDVVLLKGEAWPGNAGRGAVHRSPSASQASARLVATLDPLE